MAKLYIMRHGETEWNVEKRMQGWLDSPLTLRGRSNVEKLKERLAHIPFEAIYCSPSKRTMETASILKGDRRIKFVEMEGLREIHMGNWEGCKQEEISKNDPDLFEHFWHKPHLYHHPSGETFFELQERALKSISEIEANHMAGNVLIVTHTVVIKSLLAHFKGNSLDKLWDPPYIYDSSLTLIDIEKDGKKVIMGEGDVSHLD
ncbi:histidine phosphatase family protein [Bacillus sp. 1P06AnD]|uniref:histidine phosphatase family protein n=1 Tax=Bacillus sp. 1P06AnD TaxID=3132208 RepID=UPI0039A20265